MNIFVLKAPSRALVPETLGFSKLEVWVATFDKVIDSETREKYWHRYGAFVSHMKRRGYRIVRVELVEVVP